MQFCKSCFFIFILTSTYYLTNTEIKIMLPSFRLTSAHGHVEKANKDLRSQQTSLDKSRMSTTWIQRISLYVACEKKNIDDKINPIYDKHSNLTTIVK